MDRVRTIAQIRRYRAIYRFSPDCRVWTQGIHAPEGFRLARAVGHLDTQRAVVDARGDRRLLRACALGDIRQRLRHHEMATVQASPSPPAWAKGGDGVRPAAGLSSA
jgi:hypothetical protein